MPDLLANLISVTTEDGKAVYVAKENIASIEDVPGKPGEPAVEAADEVLDDPGVPANNVTGYQGRAPIKGHPKIEAKPAVEGVPDSTILKLKVGGDLKIKAKARDIAAQVG
jgi:hypothetical protein